MSFKEEAKEVAGFSAGWILLVILALATAGAGWWFFDRPNIDRGYSYQVNGLVTAYCTATTSTDQDRARGDIIAQRDSSPGRWNHMTSTAKSRAGQVINRDSAVCQ